jgi:hypothetical protein
MRSEPRAHLLERAGHHEEAIRYYRQAAQRTASIPERNYLLLHAARLGESLQQAIDEPPCIREHLVHLASGCDLTFCILRFAF